MGKDLKGRELGKGLTQRKDGHYSARFTDKYGKRIEKYFDKLPDAKVWLRDAVYDDAHGDINNTCYVTVDEWFKTWFNGNVAKRIKYNTRISYKGRYENRIKPIIGHLILQEVRPFHCQNVMNYCMEKEDATGSIAKIRSIMKKMFAYACENHMISSNPITPSVNYAKESGRERRVFTKEEQELFEELAKGSQYYSVFKLILDTGLRVGELAALKWENVDLNRKQINIKNTLYINNDTREYEESTPKTKAGLRTIDLTKAAYDIILDKRAVKKANIPAEFREYVFLNGNNRPITEVDVNKALQRIVKKKMGIDGYTPHCLRHTFATRCAESGMKPKTLMKVMGHSNIATTMEIYVHVTDDEMKKEMAKFAEMA